MKIVVWGVGAMAGTLVKCFEPAETEIICFVDSDAEKQGGCFQGKRIIAPQELKDEDFDLVFISSVIYQDEIMRQLREIGISRDKIISAVVTPAEMAKIYDVVTQKGMLYLSNLSNTARHNRLNAKINANTKLVLQRLGNPQKRSVHLYLKKHYEELAAQFMVDNFLEGENAPGKEALFENRWEYFDYVLDNMKKRNGLYLEFGVFMGESINFLSDRIGDNIIYGFDCFEGLPEKWLPTYGKGSMNRAGCLPEVNENVRLVKGYFDDTLPEFVREHKGEQCSFIHIDSDLYSSAKTIFTLLKDNIGSGTMICFDEFVGHIGWQEDEYKAFMEFIEETGHQYRYVAASWAETPGRCGERMAIEIL